MSTLLKALRRAEQPQFTPHIPAMGLPVTREEEQNRRWIWWLLAPLALLMGAGANYGWHLLNNRPIEKTIEVKEVVTPPFATSFVVVKRRRRRQGGGRSRACSWPSTGGPSTAVVHVGPSCR